MVLKQRLVAVITALSILISGDAVQSQGLADGGTVVVAGHSFHAPSAMALKRIASSTDAGEVGVVFVSGARGTMRALWRNQSRRDQILGMIEQLDAAVLVLPSLGGRGDEATALASWVEAASAIRADITIVLNSVHPPAGRRMSAKQYSLAAAQVYANTLSLASEATATYPGSSIQVVAGGLAASVAKELDENGALSGDHNVFRDRLGHGTPLVYTAQGLAWAREIYGLSDPVGHLGGSRLNTEDLQMIFNGIATEAARIEENPPDP